MQQNTEWQILWGVREVLDVSLEMYESPISQGQWGNCSLAQLTQDKRQTSPWSNTCNKDTERFTPMGSLVHPQRVDSDVHFCLPTIKPLQSTAK